MKAFLEHKRLKWVSEAAESVQLLHSADVLHCDNEPRNFLLDLDLGFRIADFAGSSLEHSQASACAGSRFVPFDSDFCRRPTIQDDIFALGSTIYTIMAGKYPSQKLLSNEADELYKGHQFPSVAGVTCGEICKWCWNSEFISAIEVYDSVEAEIQRCGKTYQPTSPTSNIAPPLTLMRNCLGHTMSITRA